ncbi:MAG: 1-(5-phosphoribosyl)-5-[(5-phosphoribosylamino)methylideneamino] imidazole-4-carboxamide isomerase [Candidatus Diapherotrites archaeon CG10_big_fil_rev_8_21_14_0_10_31_34]|nr:MAG: 1-(5-phosphoribosyl)-5-[(5-phosphoribosylamino)methylideneamino] imidazole-4-carboxamide isomerase [Candidatus Diapherotrites archaeon CG10_big_fil_rev_8_21_14_0_10_31_34]
MIIPSIDLIQGKVVQLEQGKNKVFEIDNPFYFAGRFKGFKEVQLIDLDAAMNKGENKLIVKEITEIVNARVGGGIRSIEKAVELIDDGAKKIIIGTQANKKFLEKLTERVPRKKIIVAVDSFKGKVVVEGWKKKTSKTPFELIKELEPYCGEFLFTCVEKEGLMNGTDFDLIKKLKECTKNELSAAGGITSIQEARKLERIGVKPIIGMALYSGKISWEEIK